MTLASPAPRGYHHLVSLTSPLLSLSSLGARCVAVVCLPAALVAQNPACVQRDSITPAGDTLHLRSGRCGPTVLPGVSATARTPEQEAFETKPSVGVVTIGAAAITAVPSVGEPDLVRVVQLLPGVQARNDYNTGLNVRGGEADQNLILLDGHPIYNPFHLGGLFSTFIESTVGGVDIMTAAFPARYGGRLSSVLDVKSAEDARPGMHATVDVSALATSGRASGALGGRGTWSFAARRTYADQMAQLFTNSQFPYHFRDLQGHASYTLPGAVRVALTAYDGRDVLDANLAALASDSAPSRASEGRWGFNWGNRVIGGTIAKELGSRLTLEQRVTSSEFSTMADVGQGTLRQTDEASERSAAGSLTRRGDRDDAAIGYDLSSYRVRYTSGSPQLQTSDIDVLSEPTSASLWVDDTWRLSTRWILQGGLRAEHYSGNSFTGLSPRASLKFFVTPDLALTAASGRETQWLHSMEGDGPLHFFDLWIASDSFIPVAKAWHYAAGFERRVTNLGSLRVEGYFKRYDRVPDVNPFNDPGVQGDELVPVQGSSYGMDVFAKWQRGSGSGWITYSYALSSRWLGDARWWPGHDRRHDLNAVATWRLSKYQLGAHLGVASGTPYTPIVGGLARRQYDPSLDHWGTGNPLIFVESIGGVRNSARYPLTHRLDLNVSRDFHKAGATWSPYVSVVNAYNARNVFVYIYTFSGSPAVRQAYSQFPILPSLGMRVAF